LCHSLVLFVLYSAILSELIEKLGCKYFELRNFMR